MLRQIWSRLRIAIGRLRHHLEEEDLQFIGVNYLDANAPAKEDIANSFLQLLTERLYEKHNKRVIVLIDEYDAPLNYAFRKRTECDFYAKASEFFGNFYSNALKGNPALKKACLMGIVEIRGAGMLSGLNNLVICSSGHEAYSEYFGFTREEVSKFLDGDEEKIKSVMTWYNGYYMGSHQMINPWSFGKYINHGELKSYWARTANFHSIQSIIHPTISVELVEIFGKLYSGQEHEIGELRTAVNYMGEATTNSILEFLTHVGYLTYRDGRVSIPNREIKFEWEDHALGLAKSKTVVPLFQQPVMDALQAAQVNISLLEDKMRNILPECSFHDLITENSYHMFFLQYLL